MVISAVVELPRLAARGVLTMLASHLGLHIRDTKPIASVGHWEISAVSCIGMSEVHIINTFIHGASSLTSWERSLEDGGDISMSVAGTAAWQQGQVA